MYYLTTFWPKTTFFHQIKCIFWAKNRFFVQNQLIKLIKGKNDERNGFLEPKNIRIEVLHFKIGQETRKVGDFNVFEFLWVPLTELHAIF